MTVISYPTPAYSNVPIMSQYYQPSRFVISAVTQGLTTIITTTVDHNYVIGQQVRMIIPPTFGCRWLNEQIAYVISIPSANQVELAIQSNGLDAFTSSTATTLPQILAVGDISYGATNTSPESMATSIPGSFTNISPI